MTTMSKQDMDRLPKWAAAIVRDLQRERDTAVQCLRSWQDGQTESAISIQELVSSGEEQGLTFYTRYVQGHRVRMETAGVYAELYQCKDRIELRFGAEGNISVDVAMVPRSFGAVDIVTKENMR